MLRLLIGSFDREVIKSLRKEWKHLIVVVALYDYSICSSSKLTYITYFFHPDKQVRSCLQPCLATQG